MAFGCEDIESLPGNIEVEDNEDMRSQSNMSDRLAVEVDCHSMGSNECPSMGSTFSPLESPTPPPTSIYSQGSIASPGWQENVSYPVHGYERGSGSTSMRGPFRPLSMHSQEHMGLPPYSNLDGQDRMAMADFFRGYDETVEQFLLHPDVPKTYDHPVHGLPCPPAMQQYPHMMRSNYRHHPAPYLPESATNPSLSRPMFPHQPERLPTSMPMSHMMPWMAHTESISPETIAPSQVAPVTPPPSFTDFSNSLSTFKTHSPGTPVRSSSLGMGSGADTPVSRLSGGGGDYMDEFQQSPGYRDNLVARPQRQPSRKVARKQSSKQSLSLENLPAVIKQVQYKCVEPGCSGRFKRQEHLKRHMKSHSKERPHVCWVPACHRKFSRSDNLNAHYTKTHSKHGGRNRYVATLDETSPDYNPDYRGPLTRDGHPIIGSTIDESISEARDMSMGGVWEE